MAKNQKAFDLFKDFVEAELGAPLESLPPVPLTGRQLVHAIWPLKEIFTPRFERIKSVQYEARFGALADAAIESWIKGDQWSDALEAGVWRVLLERQQQLITLAFAAEMQGRSIMSLPVGLPDAAQTKAIALFWLYGMILPFPVEDRSALDLPKDLPPSSLRRH